MRWALRGTGLAIAARKVSVTTAGNGEQAPRLGLAKHNRCIMLPPARVEGAAVTPSGDERCARRPAGPAEPSTGPASLRRWRRQSAARTHRHGVARQSPPTPAITDERPGWPRPSRASVRPFPRRVTLRPSAVPSFLHLAATAALKALG